MGILALLLTIALGTAGTAPPLAARSAAELPEISHALPAESAGVATAAPRFEAPRLAPYISGKYFGARYFSSQQGRFMSPDAVFAFDAHIIDPQQWNRYAYVRNNPLRYTDSTGNIIDTILDVGFIAYDIYDMAKSAITTGSVSGMQVAALGADVAGALIPVATGGGMAVRAAAHADDAVHAVEAASHIVEAGKVGEDAAQAVRAVERGRASEKAVLEAEGLAKNTTGIKAVDPKTGAVGTTIPDAMRPTGGTVEIKDVKVLSDSRQLRRQSEVSRQAGQKAEVITGSNTRVSKTVQERMRVRRRDDLGPQ